MSSTLVPAGVDKSVGIVTASTQTDPRDPQWANVPAIKEYLAFIRNYYPEGDARVFLSAFFGVGPSAFWARTSEP